jgi:hemoglobin-like flavoprotein
MLGKQEIAIVRADWAKVAPMADTAATLFYGRLFTLNPALRALFKPDLTEQKIKLMKMIGIAVNGLDDLANLVPTVRALGQRHVGYGVKVEDYDTVGAALLWTLKQAFGESFGPDHEAAWTAAYRLLAVTMTAPALSAPATSHHSTRVSS